MADGGIASLPVPDDMFNSSVGDNQQYADGGIIAFAGAGPVRAPRMSDEDYINYILQRESGGRGDFNPQGGPLTSPAGAMYAMQVRPDTARSPGYGVTPASAQTPAEYNRVGRDYAMALRDKYGDVGGLAAYNMGPGAYEAFKAGRRTMPADTRKYISGAGGAPAPARGTSASASAASAPPAAPAETLASSFKQLSDLMGVRLTKAQDAKLAALMGTPEEEKKSKDRDLGYALLEASRAFGKAGPFGSQLGEALANMAGPLREGQKTRETKKLGALTAAAEAERQDYADRAAMLSPAANLYQADVTNRLAERRQAADEDQFTRTEQRIISEAGLDRTSAETRARIAQNPTDQEGAIAAIKKDNPTMSDSKALATYLALKQMFAPAALAGDPFADAAARAAAAAAGNNRANHQMNFNEKGELIP
jgi:soluble lytic murein transglycosylase